MHFKANWQNKIRSKEKRSYFKVYAVKCLWRCTVSSFQGSLEEGCQMESGFIWHRFLLALLWFCVSALSDAISIKLDSDILVEESEAGDIFLMRTDVILSWWGRIVFYFRPSFSSSVSCFAFGSKIKTAIFLNQLLFFFTLINHLRVLEVY